jgi:very-short-patch-repair endonuclease
MANEFARALRKRLTPQEAKLWVQLRLLPKDEFHFRRQVPLGRFIVDFAEKKLRLVIEVDGSQHGEAAGLARDLERDAFLGSNGFQVLRFWNVDIDTNMSGVIDTILLAARGKFSTTE